MFFKEALLLGNTPFLLKHVGGVSSISPSASVTNVGNVPAAITSPPVEGRLQVFWQTWASVGNKSPGGVHFKERVVFQTKPPVTREPLIRSECTPPVRQELLQESVQSAVAKQATKRVPNPSSLGFYNCLFLVPKPNNRWHLILDLSALNQFLQVKTFKMETSELIRLSLQQGGVGHFSDAYFHIPINQVSRKYLRFHLKDQTAG